MKPNLDSWLTHPLFTRLKTYKAGKHQKKGERYKKLGSFGRNSLGQNYTRSFGGNCFLSASGHDVGFFDERHGGGELGAAYLKAQGSSYRFTSLEDELWMEDGAIDLSILPEYLEGSRKRLFLIK